MAPMSVSGSSWANCDSNRYAWSMSMLRVAPCMSSVVQHPTQHRIHMCHMQQKPQARSSNRRSGIQGQRCDCQIKGVEHGRSSCKDAVILRSVVKHAYNACSRWSPMCSACYKLRGQQSMLLPCSTCCQGAGRPLAFAPANARASPCACPIICLSNNTQHTTPTPTPAACSASTVDGMCKRAPRLLAAE